MNIISFAWTTPQFLLGQKTVTRRTWSDDYARRFRRSQQCAAWDKSPRFKGKHIGTIEITDIYRERVGDMPAADLALEGGRWPTTEDFAANFPQGPDTVVWVVRFRVVALTEEGRAMRAELRRRPGLYSMGGREAQK